MSVAGGSNVASTVVGITVAGVMLLVALILPVVIVIIALCLRRSQGKFIHCTIYSTVGSQLSESRLCKFSVIQMLGRHDVFGSNGKIKDLWSLEFCFRRKQSCCMNDISQMLQRLFQPVRELNHDLQLLS